MDLESFFMPPHAQQCKSPVMVVGCDGDALYDGVMMRRSAVY